MKFKRLICMAVSAMLALSVISCGDDGEPSAVKVYMPDGAPAVALASMMNSGYDRAEFTVVPATEIGSQVSTGAADMAIMPINAAANLYNKNVGIVMLTVNTHGNLFIVGDSELSGLDGLKGKRVGVIGEDNVPDLSLKMLFNELEISYERLDSVTADVPDGKAGLFYAADGPALMPLLKTDKLDYALLAEPAVSNAVKATGKQVVADMQALWKTVMGGEYPQACLVAKKSLVDNDKQYVDGFISALAASDGWAEENPDKAVEAVSSHMKEGTTSTLTALGKEIVQRCNIKTVSAQTAKTACTAYFEKLTHVTTKIGVALSKVPDDGFYYAG